jgi:hypothetical protein
MNSPRILSARAQEDKKLVVQFANGIEKIYDCAQLPGRDMFQLLKNDAFFKSVKVDAGGYGISWSDEIDLSEHELWTNGIEMSQTYKALPVSHALLKDRNDWLLRGLGMGFPWESSWL